MTAHSQCRANAKFPAGKGLTPGGDVRSKAKISALCHRLAAGGAAVIFVTSDIEERLALASRIVVVAGSRMTLNKPNRDVTRQAIVDATLHPPETALVGKMPEPALGRAKPHPGASDLRLILRFTRSSGLHVRKVGIATSWM